MFQNMFQGICYSYLQRDMGQPDMYLNILTPWGVIRSHLTPDKAAEILKSQEKLKILVSCIFNFCLFFKSPVTCYPLVYLKPIKI